MKKKQLLSLLILFIGLISPVFAYASGSGGEGISIGPIRLEFILFALTLLGVALFHNHTLYVALAGLASVVVLKLVIGFDLVHHIDHEKSIIINLFGLLVGFSILAKHFEESGVPEILPKYLADDWKGAFVLLLLVALLSSFLDNIAAAMIGGSIALVVFKGKVHIGYLAAIVAASNAGGSGSVVGDTTTTMMWIEGASPIDVSHAYLGAIPAVLIIAYFAAKQQDAFQRITADVKEGVKVDVKKLLAVGLILVGAIVTNIMLDFPALGVWVAILLCALFTKTDWKEGLHAVSGSVFLLSLVLSASMMPVDSLPDATWYTALSLGFISAVFDNIPLTKLALTQGGYDWGVLAYCVGYGGSMIWFGSSAGVALSNIFPEAKSVGNWIKHGWHVTLAYVVGFFIMFAIWGWQPHELEKKGKKVESTESIEIETTTHE